MPESADPAKALFLPQQVRIDCHNYGGDEKGCKEIAVTLGPTRDLVSVQGISTTEYKIDSWDQHGLIAAYGGDEPVSRCQRHVLTMNFESGAVSVTDIPTYKKGCEAFSSTNSYRLVRGTFYVDTTPNNDLENPTKDKR